VRPRIAPVAQQRMRRHRDSSALANVSSAIFGDEIELCPRLWLGRDYPTSNQVSGLLRRYQVRQCLDDEAACAAPRSSYARKRSFSARSHLTVLSIPIQSGMSPRSWHGARRACGRYRRPWQITPIATVIEQGTVLSHCPETGAITGRPPILPLADLMPARRRPIPMDHVFRWKRRSKHANPHRSYANAETTRGF
jgi:hypothetical protein